MINLITNIYYNKSIYNIELRNENLEKIYIKCNDKNMIYKIGNFVEVSLINGKNLIDSKILKPTNFLDFFPKSQYSREELKNKLNRYIDYLENDEYKLIVSELVNKNDDFYTYPAAKSIHHAYIGGLAEHTINILELAFPIIAKYNLNQDLLIAGAILHDYSKIKELEFYGLSYTIEGNLIGHLVMIVEEIVRICQQYNIDDHKLSILALKHLLLSHHGKLEYGAAKEPMIKEAFILNHLDEMDAKMNILNENLKSIKENTISAPIMGFDKRRFLNLNLEDNNE